MAVSNESVSFRTNYSNFVMHDFTQHLANIFECIAFQLCVCFHFQYQNILHAQCSFIRNWIFHANQTSFETFKWANAMPTKYWQHTMCDFRQIWVIPCHMPLILNDATHPAGWWWMKKKNNSYRYFVLDLHIHSFWDHRIYFTYTIDKIHWININWKMWP